MTKTQAMIKLQLLLGPIPFKDRADAMESDPEICKVLLVLNNGRKPNLDGLRK